VESPGFLFLKFPGPGKWVWCWKLLEIEVCGPGKSWNLHVVQINPHASGWVWAVAYWKRKWI